jgi:vacuolar protein sorting-associated protein 3
MAANDPGSDDAAAMSERTVSEDGPFVLRTLMDDVPLSGDGDKEDTKINCVEYLGTCCLVILVLVLVQLLC